MRNSRIIRQWWIWLFRYAVISVNIMNDKKFYTQTMGESDTRYFIISLFLLENLWNHRDSKILQRTWVWGNFTRNFHMWKFHNELSLWDLYYDLLSVEILQRNICENFTTFRLMKFHNELSSLKILQTNLHLCKFYYKL